MDTCLIGTLMVCPDDFLLFVGNVETDLAHAIHVGKCISPVIKLFYGCIPIVIQIRLMCILWYVLIGIFEILEMRIIKVPAVVAMCH